MAHSSVGGSGGGDVDGDRAEKLDHVGLIVAQ